MIFTRSLNNEIALGHTVQYNNNMGFLSGSDHKGSAYNAGDPDWEDTLEKGTATHSSNLA